LTKFTPSIVVLLACATSIGGPSERQRAADREDSDRLGAELASLPGAMSAHVGIHRPIADPLAVTRVPVAGAAVVIVVDDKADRAMIDADARRLVHAMAPEIADPTIVVEVGASRAELVGVGPFRVEAGSRRALVTVLVIALALIAGLAGWIGWDRYTRRGTSDQ
jgi:type III secretory pathway lipoprotein EscJ